MVGESVGSSAGACYETAAKFILVHYSTGIHVHSNYCIYNAVLPYHYVYTSNFYSDKYYISKGDLLKPQRPYHQSGSSTETMHAHYQYYHHHL